MMSSLPLAAFKEETTEEALHRRHNALSHPYTITTNPLLERQKARESNARSYPRRIPLALSRAKGIYVEDVDGRVFIDCLAGAGTLALGHNHPVILSAIEKVLRDELPLHTLDITTPVKDQFVEDLFGVLPESLARDAKIQFCGPTGADAVEASLKLVKTATGRSTILAFDGAYHGMTEGALNLMGNLGPKKALQGMVHGVQFLPYPYSYRCPFGLGKEATSKASLHYINNMLNDPEGGVPKPAGIILEAIQGEGGVIPAPDDWLQGLHRITKESSIPLIFDEVQSGLGRTGKMFAFEHSGVEPDVVVLSKAIGGGLPLSVVVYRSYLDEWKPGAHAGTFRGNQLAMATGSATIRYILEMQLHAHAASIGKRFTEQLLQLQGIYPCIGDVRGRGLMIGLEIIDPSGKSDTLGNPPANTALASRIQQACLQRGLILELGGRHASVIRLLPPLTISEQQLDHVFEILSSSIHAAYQNNM